MSLNFCSFSSGSSGNCYLVSSKTTALIIDAGISAKRIMEGLTKTETALENVKALLITHEHSDHIRSAGTMMKKKLNLSLYGTDKTLEAAGFLDLSSFKSVKPGEVFTIGDIAVKAFRLSHDAVDPVGYSFYYENKQISIITDTGFVHETVMTEITEADILVLEANYDADMLRIGRYPWFLKQRIAGERGHLSNEEAANTLVQLLSRKGKARRVLLAHLSKENNFPAMAYQTVKNILEEGNYYIGKHLELSTIIRDEVSTVYQI